MIDRLHHGADSAICAGWGWGMGSYMVSLAWLSNMNTIQHLTPGGTAAWHSDRAQQNHQAYAAK